MHRDNVQEIFNKYPMLKNLRVFGSVARGDDTEDSDIDFIVDAGSSSTLDDIGRLRDELEALLGISVDLQQSHSQQNIVLKKEIERDAKNLFEINHLPESRNIMCAHRPDDELMFKLLTDICKSSNRIIERINGISHKKFISGEDNDIQDIVARHFTVIGEAAASILKRYNNFCQEYPEIKLQKARRLRNLIVHEYDEINWASVWDTAINDLPELRDEIGKVLHQQKKVSTLRMR
jgi:uncharacterized protein with HEPN domain/predicted nucleotidyltransferase